MIDQDHLGADIDRRLAHFLCLAATEKKLWVGAVAPTGDGGCHLNSGGLGQLGKLVEIFLFDRCTETESNEYGLLAAAGTLKHGATELGSLGDGIRIDAAFGLFG